MKTNLLNDVKQTSLIKYFVSSQVSISVVLNHGVATHLCVASFFWCVAKSFQTLTLSFWYMNLALNYTKK